MRMAEREIAEFRKLEGLHKELVAIKAQICQIRPIEAGTASQEVKSGRHYPPRNGPRQRRYDPNDFRTKDLASSAGVLQGGSENWGIVRDNNGWPG